MDCEFIRTFLMNQTNHKKKSVKAQKIILHEMRRIQNSLKSNIDIIFLFEVLFLNELLQKNALPKIN